MFTPEPHIKAAFHRENRSIVVELTEEQYQRLHESSTDLGMPVSELARAMLRYGFDSPQRRTRKISFWVTREFHDTVKMQAARNRTSFKRYVHNVLVDCIADLQKRKIIGA